MLPSTAGPPPSQERPLPSPLLQQLLFKSSDQIFNSKFVSLGKPFMTKRLYFPTPAPWFFFTACTTIFIDLWSLD